MINLELKNEINEYVNAHYTFDDFIDMHLGNENLMLLIISKKKAVPERQYVPVYCFEVYRNNTRIGKINLRIGYNENLYYCGNIGYAIDVAFRGHGYAAQACKLLIPLMKAHSMNKVIITNEKNNIASKRTCINIGAKLLRIVDLPNWTPMYQEGERLMSIFEWRF